MRSFLLAILLTLSAQTGLACSCIPRSSPCESLGVDAVFVGRVVSTKPVRHPMDKASWTNGYTMQFDVSESLKGGLGSSVTIETGSGGGDCGTPLPEGKRFFVFAYKNKDGKLWTGMCSGNWALDDDGTDEKRIAVYRKLTTSNLGSIFGRITQSTPIWKDDDQVDRNHRPMAGLTVHAHASDRTFTTKTGADGTYNFDGLPNGTYTIVPEQGASLDFSHEYEEAYRKSVADGACADVTFRMQPSTRIKGHVEIPEGIGNTTLEVEALPVSLKKLNQFSGRTDFIDENGDFDLWPLPPGDYYVGVNINSSPKADAPFPPTYYPGVTHRATAEILHIKQGEIKKLTLPLHELAKPRTVHFVAIGLDGKPLKTVYVQLEDLRHPGDAVSYVNVDLDAKGEGTMTVYQDFDYHLHASHWVSYMNDWCAKPVSIPSGSAPVETRFSMIRKAGNCDIYEIDGIKR